ncbi:MAG: DUF3301 domain-containing protein [Rudaea sp.]
MLPLVLLLLAAYLWQAALRSREHARALGHALCRRAQVQLLDDTVALQRLRIGRGSDGWLHWLRRYRFELSTDGRDRHFGSLDILGENMISYSLPLIEQTPGATVGSAGESMRLPPSIH